MMSLLLLQTILLSHLRASPYRLKHVIHASSTFLLFQAAIAAMELVFAFRVGIIHHTLCRRPVSAHHLLIPAPPCTQTVSGSRQLTLWDERFLSGFGYLETIMLVIPGLYGIVCFGAEVYTRWRHMHRSTGLPTARVPSRGPLTTAYVDGAMPERGGGQGTG